MLSGPEVLDIARQGIWTLLILASPLMLIALAVGLAVALVQALTQVQEITLVFVPKILAIFVTLLIAMPFMGDALSAYMMLIVDHIVTG